MSHTITLPRRNEDDERLVEAINHELGTSRHEFLSMLLDVVRSLREPRIETPGSSQLTKSEIAGLRTGGLDPDASAEFYTRALLRTAAGTADLGGTALTVAEVARRLHRDQSRVRQMLLARELYGMKLHGAWRIPDFQFSGDGVVPGLPAVLRAVPWGLHPLALRNWLMRPELDLEIDGRAVSPLDWLESGGDPEVVVALAADL